MTRSQPALCLAGLLAAWLLLSGPALAVFPPPVKDDGKFFSKEGLEKANKKIKDIYQKYRKDVVVETLADLTEEQLKKAKAEGNDKFFPKFALGRIDALGVNGVYILLSKKPQRVQIEMDTQTRKRVFHNADRSKAVKKLIDKFKKEDFDAGLIEALDSIEASLKANSK